MFTFAVRTIPTIQANASDFCYVATEAMQEWYHSKFHSPMHQPIYEVKNNLTDTVMICVSLWIDHLIQTATSEALEIKPWK